MQKKITIIVTSVIFNSYALGNENRCPTWPTYYVDELCNCGEHLNNLEITVPTDMKIMSACLYDPRSSPRRSIDLSKEKASLDRYTNGNIPHGTIYLSGELTIDGDVFVDEGPAAVFWFYPKWDFSQSDTPFSKEISSFKFLDEGVAATFKIDKSLVVKGCSIAQAKIQISGLRVSIGDTDEAGAYPVKAKVLHVGEYRPCK